MVFRQILCLSLLFLTSSLSKAQTRLYDLKCEYLTNPINIDKEHPRFTWKLEDERYGVKQSSFTFSIYQHDGEDSTLIWTDTKKSSKTLYTYNGPKLSAFTKYSWDVSSVLSNSGPTQSNSAFFETAMLNKEDWQGDWITDQFSIDYEPASHFRKNIQIPGNIRRARLYIAAAGLHDLSINGKEVTETLLNPAFTRYDKRILYNTYDITDLIESGSNLIGVILGNGWYNHQAKTVWEFDEAPWRGRPSMLLNLKVELENGEILTFTSDNSWKVTDGPITFNSIFLSEQYDFNKEMLGWNEIGYNDANWSSAKVINSPTEKLESQLFAPIRKTEILQPIEFTKKNQTNYLYKFPKNIAGITKISAIGSRGTILEIKHSEQVDDQVANNSHFLEGYDESLVQAFQTDKIILAGGAFTFSPKFNYKGFQYVEINTSEPIELNIESLVAYSINTDLSPIGDFVTGNEIINKIWQASNRSYLANMMGYPTDNPHREKNGWTADGHIMSESGLYNFQAISVYEKWMRDHQDSQNEYGNLPYIIPSSGWGFENVAIDWTSSAIIVPWEVYLMTGDSNILQENYAMMYKFIAHQLASFNTYGIGDWLPANTISDNAFTTHCYLYHAVDLLSKIALVFAKAYSKALQKQMAQAPAGVLHDELSLLLFFEEYWPLPFFYTALPEYSLSSGK